ncbi:MAG: hypothetical protein Greene041619_471 [Candidatus Peregrinibacteria bacterium Greene0416_19]|nr:MAG: hypothetical protein Greene041619_471 [Candidatus Peregrinibacteria bacterium Greene0416_19]
MQKPKKCYTSLIHLYPHRHRFLTVSLMTAGLLAGRSAHAAFQVPPLSNTQSVSQIPAIQNQIVRTLDAAQCGGWSTDPRESVQGKIPRAGGVPGRTSDPLGNPGSGMGKRQETDQYTPGKTGNGFFFPTWNHTTGMLTVCEEKKGNIDKRVYSDGDLPGTKNKKINIAHPYFEDPPCLWKDRQQKDTPPHNLGKCTNFCSWLNDSKWTYQDCRIAVPLSPPIPDLTGKVWYGKCVTWAKRWTCSDEWVDPLVPRVGSPGQKNCLIDAKGKELRCSAKSDDTCKKSAENNKPYRSFYRSYKNISASRSKINDAPRDALSDVRNGQAACYGFYDEFDPRSRKTETKDQRCVIDLPVQWQNLRNTQSGKGHYKPNPLPIDLFQAPRNPRFNAATDTWYPNLGSALSFLSIPGWKGNLSEALLNPDKAVVQAVPQNTQTAPRARQSILRSVDDSVSNARRELRPFTRWWQQFETDAHRLFTPPLVHLRLPVSWSYRLDALRPLETTLIDVPASGTALQQAIDVQLTAQDDLVGLLGHYLKQSLILPVREEPVPVVVPAGSPVEFRTAAALWKEWKSKRDAARLPVPAEVDSLIDTLEQYAKQIESYHGLRGEIAKYLSVLLMRQENLLRYLQSWIEQNGRAYDKHLKQFREREELQNIWRSAQKQFVEFSDITNMPWCRNDRFTTPIYSLLDPWYPPRPDLQDLSPACNPTGPDGQKRLPMLCPPAGEADLIWDLSVLKVSSGSLKVPVLKPIQIRMQIPLPGSVLDPASLPTLPPLPDVLLVQWDRLDRLLPNVVFGASPPVLPDPPAFNAAQARSALEHAKMMIAGMNDTYKKFWQSLDRQARDAPKCNGRALQPLECCGWQQASCVHVEMDLMERIERITARPAVLLKEDKETQGIGRTFIPPLTAPPGAQPPRKDATCLPDDHACITLQGERTGGRGGVRITIPQEPRQPSFDINNPDFDPVESMRAEERGYTLNPNGTIRGGTPYVTPPWTLYPVFGVPRPVDLFPPRKP